MLLNKKNPHGGDIYKSSVMLDFSSNINPFGMPENVKKAVRESISYSSHYPDPYCLSLRAKLSEKEKVTKKWILCGNGASELIYSFAYSLNKNAPALIVSPTFSEYQTALSAAGIESRHFMLSDANEFELKDEFAKTDFSKYCAVFICTPNNPTGKTVNPDLFRKLAQSGIRVFCDMCFLDFANCAEEYDTAKMLKDYNNIVILKAFTKNYALTGLRLGYAMCSDTEFLDSMSQKVPCWNVSIPAEKGGIAALDCEEWLSECVKYVKSERERVKTELSSLGVKVFDSEANFLLFYSDVPLYEPMLSKGILIRDCENFEGLSKGFFRIAIKKAEENNRILSAMKEVLG